MYAIAIRYRDWEGKPATYSAVRGTVSDAAGFTRQDALHCAQEIVDGINSSARDKWRAMQRARVAWPSRYPRTRAKVRYVKPARN
jgi:hypothetical protein